jgi:Uma2 family endonuclease
MTIAKQRFLSFEEYLAYEVGTENLYEFCNGELLVIPPASGTNVQNTYPDFEPVLEDSVCVSKP